MSPWWVSPPPKLASFLSRSLLSEHFARHFQELPSCHHGHLLSPVLCFPSSSPCAGTFLLSFYFSSRLNLQDCLVSLLLSQFLPCLKPGRTCTFCFLPAYTQPTIHAGTKQKPLARTDEPMAAANSSASPCAVAKCAKWLVGYPSLLFQTFLSLHFFTLLFNGMRLGFLGESRRQGQPPKAPLGNPATLHLIAFP